MAKAADRSSPLKLPHGYQIYNETNQTKTMGNQIEARIIQKQKVGEKWRCLSLRCESYCWFHPRTKDRHDDKTHLLGLGADKEVEDRESIGSGHGGGPHLLLHFVHFTLSLVLATHHGGNVGLSLFHFHGGSILDDDGLLRRNQALSSKRRGRGGCGPGIDGAEGNCCREDEENSGRGVHCYLLCRVFLDCNPLHSNINSRFCCFFSGMFTTRVDLLKMM